MASSLARCLFCSQPVHNGARYCSNKCTMQHSAMLMNHFASEITDVDGPQLITFFKKFGANLPNPQPCDEMVEVDPLKMAFLDLVATVFRKWESDDDEDRKLQLVSDFARVARGGIGDKPAIKPRKYLDRLDKAKGKQRDLNPSFVNEYYQAVVCHTNRKKVTCEEKNSCLHGEQVFEALLDAGIVCTCKEKSCYLKRATKEATELINALAFLPPCVTFGEIIKLISIDDQIKYNLITSPLEILARKCGQRDAHRLVKSFGETMGFISDSNKKRRMIDPFLKLPGQEHVFIFFVDAKRMYVQTRRDFIRRLVRIVPEEKRGHTYTIKQLWRMCPDELLPTLFTMKPNSIADISIDEGMPIWDKFYAMKSTYYSPLEATPINPEITPLKRSRANPETNTHSKWMGFQLSKPKHALNLKDEKGDAHMETYKFLDANRELFTKTNSGITRLGGKTWIVSTELAKSEMELRKIDGSSRRDNTKFVRTKAGCTYKGKKLKHVPIELFSFWDAIKLYREMRTMNSMTWLLKARLLRSFPWRVVLPFTMRRAAEMSVYATANQVSEIHKSKTVDFDPLDRLHTNLQPWRVHIGDMKDSEIEACLPNLSPEVFEEYERKRIGEIVGEDEDVRPYKRARIEYSTE